MAIARVWRIAQLRRWARLSTASATQGRRQCRCKWRGGDPITDARRVRRCGLMATLSSFRSARNGTRLSRSGQRTWDGPHTSLRLIQAFKTLSAIPVANGPRFKSSWWPHAPMEWIDIKAKEHEYLNDFDQAREAARQWHGHDTGLRRKKSAVWKQLCPGGTLSAPSSSSDACCADGCEVPIDRS